MTLFGLSNNDISLIVALIALGGVFISTLATAARAGKSKYIDVIAAERIRWVDKLRRDFADFHDLLARRQMASGADEVDEAVRLNLELVKLAGLIDLKLNFEAKIDRAIVSTMRRCLHAEPKPEPSKAIKALGTDVVNLRILVRYLLKDEWEKAKVESSGPLNRLRLNRRRNQRRKQFLAEIDKLPSQLIE